MVHHSVVVITGGASGIGQALAQAFYGDEGTAHVVVIVDLDMSRCQVAVEEIQQRTTVLDHAPNRGASWLRAIPCDVTDAHQVQEMIRTVTQDYGRIDIYCSNAGRIFLDSSADRNNRDAMTRKYSNEQWDQLWKLHVQSHVLAARALLPDWENAHSHSPRQQQQRKPIFCITASAAGLLTMIGDASYGVTKAAAISFAEHLAIAHPHIQVHCLCPQAVDTPLWNVKGGGGGGGGSLSLAANAATTNGVVSAEYVAKCTLQAMRQQDTFWIFPHPQVADYVKHKAMDHARWLKGMQRFQQRLFSSSNQSETTNPPATQQPQPPQQRLQSHL